MHMNTVFMEEKQYYPNNTIAKTVRQCS
jgi:hypothetical protein